MVAVLGRHLRPNLVEPQRLELHPDQRSQHVVEERLIDFDVDYLAGHELTARQVFGQYRLRDRPRWVAHRHHYTKVAV